MRKLALRAARSAIVAATLLAFTPRAQCDTPANAMQAAVSGANVAIKNVMNAAERRKQGQQVAQVPPVQQPPTGAKQGLPLGLTYMLDASAAYPLGNIGTYGKKWLPGGMDAVLGYGFSSTERLTASYYEIQHYPYGFNSGTVPLYLQGLGTPIGSVNLGTTAQPLDITTKDRFFLANWEQLFILGNVGKVPLPIVISPTYVARWSTIGASNGNSDVVPFEVTPGTSIPYTNVHTRTSQYSSVGFTLPFLKTPKFFGTFTIAPTWLVHVAGVNQQNFAQLYQILYVDYEPTPTTTIFIEPQSSRDYLPFNPYAQHVIDYFAGVSQRFTRYGFVQIVLNSGGPTNYSPYGVVALTCQQLPCNSNQVVPTVGGLKATQLQFQIGVGSPSVIPF